LRSKMTTLADVGRARGRGLRAFNLEPKRTARITTTTNRRRPLPISNDATLWHSICGLHLPGMEAVFTNSPRCEFSNPMPNWSTAMATQEQVIGNWNELKGKLKQKWGQLTDDELGQVEGNFDQLVGLIQRKTGGTRKEIENMVTKLNEETGGRLRQAGEKARQYVDQAGEAVRDVSERARERTMERYDEAREMVSYRPIESVAVAFGTGLLVGLMIGLVAGSRYEA